MHRDNIKLLEKTMTYSEVVKYLELHPKYRLLSKDELESACYEKFTFMQDEGKAMKFENGYVVVWNKTDTQSISTGSPINVAVTICDEYTTSVEDIKGMLDDDVMNLSYLRTFVNKYL